MTRGEANRHLRITAPPEMAVNRRRAGFDRRVSFVCWDRRYVAVTSRFGVSRVRAPCFVILLV